ncbi:MAG TPA: hypothetical protein PLY58_01490 [Bacilli bacterium]|jgi:hypothetical protein|nr:hypothetical protein [Bacilli bacterium]HQA55749.1 hypothetical protein [Bacilli bacterium]
MNKTSQYIFNIYHYLLQLRDTLEYCINRDHEKLLYDQRKTVLEKGIEDNTPLGNFLKNNPEQGDKIKGKIKEFLDDVYSPTSTVLAVEENGKVRVDHTQHIKLLDYVTGLSESIRDIIYGYLSFAKSKNESESIITDLVSLDDRLYRTILAMLALKDYEASFGEFQKTMSETKGQPSPQSNFIVQNELMKLAGFIRFSRSHAHCTDNETLDLLDEVNATIEMCEGKRERRDNKPFKEIFEAINKRLNSHIGKVEPAWKETFNKAFQEALELTRKEAQDANNSPAA